MKTKAIFERKTNKFDDIDCKIECVVNLSADEYKSFRQNMLTDYPFVADNIDRMYTENCDGINSMAHCLLVLGEGNPDGVLIESSGYSYARYAALLPNAREFIQKNIQTMAEEIIKEGTANTDNGNWILSFNKISQHFDTTVNAKNGVGEMLVNELQTRDEVSDVAATEDGIDMTYYLDYCPKCRDGSECLMTLNSLLNCNFEDVHLVHADEEHDLATICEINNKTLTEKGKIDWSDILNAKVHRVYQGYYGLQVEVSGCKPQRLSDFSHMLAGDCSMSDYNNWVNQVDDGETFDIKMK